VVGGYWDRQEVAEKRAGANGKKWAVKRWQRCPRTARNKGSVRQYAMRDVAHDNRNGNMSSSCIEPAGSNPSNAAYSSGSNKPVVGTALSASERYHNGAKWNEQHHRR